MIFSYFNYLLYINSSFTLNPHTAVVIAQDVMVGKELDRPWQDAVKKVLGADFLHLLGRQHFGFTFEHSFPPSAVFADSGRG